MHILVSFIALAVFAGGVYGIYRLAKKNGDI
jgi:hypothetical protein